MPDRPAPSVVIAAAWMAGALVFFTLMAVASREMSHSMGTFQIVFIRYGLSLLMLAPFVLRNGWSGVRTGNLKVQILRNLSSYIGGLGWFYAIGVLPLAFVLAVEFTAPVWVAILAVWWLGERLTAARIVALALGLAGILVILRPGFEAVSWAMLASVVGAIGFAGSHVGAKKLAGVDRPILVVFYMALLQVPMGAIPAILTWQPITGYAWGWAVVLALAATLGHLFLNRAFQRADATVVVPMDFLRVPLIAVIAWAAYEEAIDAWVMLGALFIFAGNYFMIRRERAAPGSDRDRS